MSAEIIATRFRFAVNILPKDGILDPQGRAVEQSLPHLGLAGIGQVRVGRRVELAVDAPDATAARTLVDELARELLCNPMIEQYAIEALGAISAARGEPHG
jgi:phosphoribosylformylglycinamidine synthase PurS subunit